MLLFLFSRIPSIWFSSMNSQGSRGDPICSSHRYSLGSSSQGSVFYLANEMFHGLQSLWSLEVLVGLIKSSCSRCALSRLECSQLVSEGRSLQDEIIPICSPISSSRRLGHKYRSSGFLHSLPCTSLILLISRIHDIRKGISVQSHGVRACHISSDFHSCPDVLTSHTQWVLQFFQTMGLRPSW